MALVMTPIYTQTASGSAILVSFNNIPQFYTDLKLVASVRSNQAASTFKFITLFFNGDQASTYSSTRLAGDGATASSSRQSNDQSIYVTPVLPAASITANTFANVELYFPNYSGANFKQVLIDGVAENNATTAQLLMQAGLWRNTAAITSIILEVGDYGNTFTANSTFSLYGIIRSGA